MGRSLPSEREQELSPVLAVYPAHPTFSSIPDRHIKSSTVPPTGSPTLAPKPSYRHQPEDDILIQPLSQGFPEPQRANYRPVSPPPDPPDPSDPPVKKQPQKTSINDFPTELHQKVIDEVAGQLGTPKSSHGSRNWSSAMRHPRRKQLSDLALVSRTWRLLIQERLYRHLKIKGTRAELQKSGEWLLTHPRLQAYVRHVEIWVPLFEVAAEPRPRPPLRAPPGSPISETPSVLRNPRVQTEDLLPTRRMFQTLDIVSLEEIYACAKIVFPEACVLTIEGGHCKKSRKVQVAKNVNLLTLQQKGSWNIIREVSDFENMAIALPNMREWHCVYAKPKTDAYIAMCGVLRHFPPTITKISICLEGLNGKQPSSLAKWRKLYPEYHICEDLGRLFPQLESLIFTGHVCACFFKSAIKAASSLRDVPKLKSIDLFVRNCCRESTDLDDGPSIHNWPFIQAFEKLVVQAVTALGPYPQLEYMRIRFLDLDSPRPLLNPYFHLENNICTGMWDSTILAALREARPWADFETTADEGIMDWFEGPVFSRPKSMKASSYAALAQVGTVI